MVTQSQACYLGPYESVFPGCGHSYLNQNKLLDLLRAVFSDEIGSASSVFISSWLLPGFPCSYRICYQRLNAIFSNNVFQPYFPVSVLNRSFI